ncbi:xaa-Pro aminopeptidase 3-like [Penaeus japonicus]|uniref:xaa-Pro aminopeptidase 3-like n=1 Tax=Penaeus japonicus TaxID=27405 RepID=UPI001C713892|nr:xaa-Pro aminopeptidase 3-like [Penaeus japonicus]
MDVLRRSCRVLVHKSKRFSASLPSVNQRLCHSVSQVGEPKDEGSRLSGEKKTPRLLRAGQPLPHTHPHLVQPGEITFGITRGEYAERRHKLMERLGQREGKHHVVILPATPRRYMIDKIPYLYRQDTDMLYMSGCLEADCVLVLHSLPGRKLPTHKAVMFTPRHDPSQELWDGPRTGPAGASDVWGVDMGLPLSELTRYLGHLESDLSSPTLWYHNHTPPNPEIHRMIQSWVVGGRQGGLESPKSHLHALRVIKSPAEIELMRHTCRISGESLAATMRATRAPVMEHQLFATVDYQCRMRGGDYLAYPPVVAGGQRANIIHYINNNQIINPGEMVLMDAGSEFRGYSGDVTRTWPISGEFTPAQRDVYEAVLEVQQEVIAACIKRPTLDQLFSIMCAKLGAVLKELCILPTSFSNGQLMRAAYGFCPHHVSHYLGMDVHDTPTVPRNNPLKAGCVITVEPGIYISENNSSVPSRYLGIGVRLEDDILITEDGVEVLSSSCPKHPDEIEAIVGADYK